jgi:hypothetical protein
VTNLPWSPAPVFAGWEEQVSWLGRNLSECGNAQAALVVYSFQAELERCA